MLKATDLTKAHDGAPLFDALSFTLDDGARAGLVGVNGVGKTTLLRLLAGADRPDRGAVAAGAADRVGYLAQDVLDPRATIDDLLRRALGEVWELRVALDSALARGDLEAYGDAQERFEALGGWTLEARLDEARRRLGIEHLDRATRLGRLSGGEAARCLLAAVTLGEPTVLLLDEPTNHLDAEGRAWLADWLARFDGTLLAVSHDRAFLDATVGRILELSAEGLESYEGGYTAYKAERERRRERLAQLVEAQEKRRRRLAEDIRLTSGYAEHTERTVSRAEAPKLKRYAKKVAKKAKAREHRLRREMESADWVRAPRDPAAFVVRMETDDPGRRLVAALRGVSVAGVLDDVSLTLHGRERVGLTGPNGGGKSTLLHVRAGVLEPGAGEVDVRARVRLLPQTPARLPARRPLLAWFREQVVLPEDEARTLLAHYRLGAEAIGRPLGRLSPGERARVHVAAIVASGADLVLLDEPTNHLDFDTLEVIEAALRTYRGTLVVASHDYALLEAIGCERLVEVREGALSENASAISS